MRVSAEELKAGSFEPERRRAAIADFNANGYITIEGALPEDLVAELRRSYLKTLEAKQARLGITPVEVTAASGDKYGRPMFKPMGGNHDVNRWNMHLPSRMPFLDPRVIANPFALEILESVMGDDCVLAMMASDTAFPGSQKQEIHQDAFVPRFTLNIAIVDFTEENGPTEVWPGTHRKDPGHGESFDYDMPPLSIDRIKELVKTIPVKRMIVKAGTLFLRDHRLLHRGTENHSPDARPMLSLLYFAPDAEVPYRGVTQLAARAALRVREVVRRLPAGPRQAEVLNRANAAGRIVEFSARSDRDYRRVIPRDVWNELPVRAKKLLRFAAVEGAPNDEAQASVRASYTMLRTAFKGMSAAIGGARGPATRKD